jgi:hypothetical protein
MKAAFIADARQGSMHDFSKHDGACSIVGGLLEGDPFQALARIGAGHGLQLTLKVKPWAPKSQRGVQPSSPPGFSGGAALSVPNL